MFVYVAFAFKSFIAYGARVRSCVAMSARVRQQRGPSRERFLALQAHVRARQSARMKTHEPLLRVALATIWTGEWFFATRFGGRRRIVANSNAFRAIILSFSMSIVVVTCRASTNVKRFFASRFCVCSRLIFTKHLVVTLPF